MYLETIQIIKRSICPIGYTLTSTTASNQSGPGDTDNKGVTSNWMLFSVIRRTLLRKNFMIIS